MGGVSAINTKKIIVVHGDRLHHSRSAKSSFFSELPRSYMSETYIMHGSFKSR